MTKHWFYTYIIQFNGFSLVRSPVRHKLLTLALHMSHVIQPPRDKCEGQRVHFLIKINGFNKKIDPETGNPHPP